MASVDLNADLGESFGAYTLGMDHEIIRHVTSANIACGFHAGDPCVMEKTVQLAKDNHVSVGAHPGYPDLQGFGRREMKLTPQEARASVLYQVGALDAFLKLHGLPLQHVKLHGALYNTAAINYDLALCICEGLKNAYPDCIFLGLAGSTMLKAAREVGLAVASEVFADRAYMDDGTLVPRKQNGSVLHDVKQVIARTIQMVKAGTVQSISGKWIPIQADSVCVHGDNAEALDFVKSLRNAFDENDISVQPLHVFSVCS